MTGWVPGRVGLYRLYDAARRLLYVGIGEIPEVRWKAHAKRADWWSQVDLTKTVVVWFDSRAEAEAAEKAAIKTECPLHNVVHTPRHAERMRKPEHLKSAPSDGHDIRRFRVHDEIWEMYTEIVGDRGRSEDLRAYMDWRATNPTTPLPGRWRGPLKRWRKPTRAERIKEGLPA